MCYQVYKVAFIWNNGQLYAKRSVLKWLSYKVTLLLAQVDDISQFTFAAENFYMQSTKVEQVKVDW